MRQWPPPPVENGATPPQKHELAVEASLFMSWSVSTLIVIKIIALSTTVQPQLLLFTTKMGFSDLSDTDESAIDEIISQAQDACVLEQVSAINCSGFTDSVLPTDLESRFRKLKSFPVTKSKRNTTTPPPYDAKSDDKSTINWKSKSENSVKGKLESKSLPDEQSLEFSPSKENPEMKMGLDSKLQSLSVSSTSDFLDSLKEKVELSPLKENTTEKKGVKEKPKYGSVSSPSGSSNTSQDSSISSLFKPNSEEKKSSKAKSKSGFLASPLSCSNSLRDSPSPPRKAGCFWCSPKKSSKKKSKENWAMGDGLGLDYTDEFLSDMGSFSSKNQQKLLKKAMKEEEKISREAEKIVQWAKQQSARMNVSNIEDDLSDE